MSLLTYVVLKAAEEQSKNVNGHNGNPNNGNPVGVHKDKPAGKNSSHMLCIFPKLT